MLARFSAWSTPELQTQVAEKAAAQGFSVRQVERLVKKVNEPREPSEDAASGPEHQSRHWEIWKQRLGTRVRIVEKSDQRGRIEIEYYSQQELQRIYEWIISTGSDTTN